MFSKVISYSNYINRVADALGLDPEPEMQEAFERWQKSSAQSGAGGRQFESAIGRCTEPP